MRWLAYDRLIWALMGARRERNNIILGDDDEITTCICTGLVMKHGDLSTAIEREQVM